MNKKLTIASALLAASAAFAFETWHGDSEQVETGLGNDTETYGYWFSYGDDGDGGNSKVTWPVALGNEYSDDSMGPVIEECNGICGTAVLDKGTLTYNPFIGVGFNVVGETAVGDPTPAAGDASSWGGVCISYTAAAAPTLELGLGDEVDASIGYANPSASLAKATAAPVTKTIAWTGFAQPSWYKGTTKKNGTEAAAQLVALKFKIQAAPGNYDFNIMSIGPFDGTCSGSAVKSLRGASSAKAILSGRTLGFSGVNSATAEVLNLQGQVVAKGVISNASASLSLASLDAGVYMVRVAGKSVNFTNKIVLK